MIKMVMENISFVEKQHPGKYCGWYCRYHIQSDRMLNVRILQAGGEKALYIDQEFNIFESSEFYPWKTTE